MASETSFTWDHYLPTVAHTLEGYGVDPHPAITLVISSVVLIVFAYFAGKKFRSPQLVKSDGKLNFSNLIGYSIESLYLFVQANVGKLALSTFWILGGFFLYILYNNLFGMIPGFAPPTDKFSITLGLGLFSFVLYNYLGIRAHKWHYIKHFLGPSLWLAPLLFCIEIISHLARPATLGLRLFGNMVGDHTVLNVFSQEIFPVLVPVPFMFLGLFVSVVQAYVFFQLSMVYVSGSIEDAH